MAHRAGDPTEPWFAGLASATGPLFHNAGRAREGDRGNSACSGTRPVVAPDAVLRFAYVFCRASLRTGGRVEPKTTRTRPELSLRTPYGRDGPRKTGQGP